MEPQPTPQQQRLVWWVLWFAFQTGVVVMFAFLRKTGTSPEAATLPWWQLAFLPALVSGAIRWTALPMFKDAQKALPIFIVGIAMAEASCFLGLFVFPAHRTPLFIASFVGILQFIPVYYDRYFRSDTEA